MQYYLGIDGGGTKTEYALANERGQVVFTHKTKGSSHQQYGVDGVVQDVSDAINLCITMGQIEANDLLGICFGMPCFGEDLAADNKISYELKKQFAKIPFYITNDVEVAWAGALAGAVGINIVAGTGSIAFGKDLSGKSARCGGWGEFVGDEGSCYWLGRKAMELFTKQADGRLQKGALYEIIANEFTLTEEFSFIDIMQNEYSPFRDKVASMQILLLQAAKAGDNSAMVAYEMAAEELALQVFGVSSGLNFEGEVIHVSYSGGLFKAEEIILAPFNKKIAALGGQLQKPKLTPVDGAILCALREFAPQLLMEAQTNLAKR